MSPTCSPGSTSIRELLPLPLPFGMVLADRIERQSRVDRSPREAIGDAPTSACSATTLPTSYEAAFTVAEFTALPIEEHRGDSNSTSSLNVATRIGGN